MIVTDGAQTEPGDLHLPADKLKSRGFEIYTVAAGDARKYYLELERLKNKDMFSVSEASGIPKLIDEVAQAICPSTALSDEMNVSHYSFFVFFNLYAMSCTLVHR